jgi:F-type H+-transporting ATPase subunit b
MADLLTSLNINPEILLMNGILFVILLVVLNAMFWKPMMHHLEKRRDDITGAYRKVEDTRKEMEKLRDEYQVKLNGIETDARQRIQQTVREAQIQREKVLADARVQSEQIIHQGQISIDEESNQAMLSMQKELDDLALRTLTSTAGIASNGAQRTLIQEYLSQKANQS